MYTGTVVHHEQTVRLSRQAREEDATTVNGYMYTGTL